MRFAAPSALARLAASAFVTAVACLIWLPLRVLPPRLIDQCDEETSAQRFPPIVAVGVIIRDSLVQKPVPMHADPSYPLQLRKLEIRVENVLRGNTPRGLASVFYFAFAGGYEGPQPLGVWHVGSRRIFFLRRDSGVLRTVCDGWDYCTRGVYSGAHPGFIPEPGSSLENVIAGLVLTRGEGEIDDDRFAGDIRRGTPGSEDHLIERYRELALTKGSLVKAAACTGLWLSTLRWSPVPTRELATNSMRVAGCTCYTKASGWMTGENGLPDCGPEGTRYVHW